MTGEMLPHDAVTDDEAAVVLSFWGLLPAHGELVEQTQRVEREWRERLLGHLREAVDAGELDPAAPLADLADSLLMLFDAARLKRVQQTETGVPVRQWHLLRRVIAPRLTERGGAVPFGPA